jgi:hypothetical protein
MTLAMEDRVKGVPCTGGLVHAAFGIRKHKVAFTKGISKFYKIVQMRLLCMSAECFGGLWRQVERWTSS